MSLQPTTPAEVQAAVRDYPRLLPRGAGSKPALSTPPDEVASLDLSELAGILEYEPGEFTFTALAGTPVAEVEQTLAKHGHYLPFDPLLARRGATLGGVVASGTSGSGRFRYGGVRDFLLGVRFVDGEGRLVRGGGKVVKNSAGFDLPKFMIGSLGRLSILTELTFKVFPKPAAYTTLQLDYAKLKDALAAIRHLMTSFLEADAVDLQPSGSLWIRVGGLPEVLPERVERLQTFLTKDIPDITGATTLQGDEEEALWRGVREFEWVPAGWNVAKVPLTAGRIPGLEKALTNIKTERRYAVGGKLGWIAWPGDDQDVSFQALNAAFGELGLVGLVLLGPAKQYRLGTWPGQLLLRRVKQALDPANRFLDV